MASLKYPKLSTYNFKPSEIKLLVSTKTMHPGNHRNLTVFWPLYLESQTKNVHLFNFTLIYNPRKPRNYQIYFHDYLLSPLTKQYAKANLGRKITKKRYIYIILVINHPSEVTAHANGLLYDTEKQTLERFEPHGSENPIAYAKIGPQTAKKIKEYLEANLGITIKRFNQPKSTCPKIGWQLKEKYPLVNNSKFNKTWKISGYCAAWSMYFLLLRINNPNIPPKKLQEITFSNYNNTSVYIHRFYYDFLRWKVDFLQKHKKD